MTSAAGLAREHRVGQEQSMARIRGLLLEQVAVADMFDDALAAAGLLPVVCLTRPERLTTFALTRG